MNETARLDWESLALDPTPLKTMNDNFHSNVRKLERNVGNHCTFQIRDVASHVEVL